MWSLLTNLLRLQKSNRSNSNCIFVRRPQIYTKRSNWRDSRRWDWSFFFQSSQREKKENCDPAHVFSDKAMWLRRVYSVFMPTVLIVSFSPWAPAISGSNAKSGVVLESMSGDTAREATGKSGDCPEWWKFRKLEVFVIFYATRGWSFFGIVK